ncbi:MAG: hypothetical protein ABL857_05065, partial [Rickettsiales bacterium]
IIIFIFGGGFFLYQKFGTPEILPLMAQRGEKLEILKQKIIENSSEVKENPNNFKAWVNLGNSFMETSQFSAAVNAYKQAVLLSDGNPILIMAYARALIMEADGTVTADAKKSLDILLLLQPQHEEARYFLAVQKMQSGDTQTAMSEMKELYKSLADNSPIKEMINHQIGRK